MTTTSIISLEDFLSGPLDDVVKVSPAAVVFAAGGTRRSAALAGMRLGREFVEWNLPRLLESCALFFRLGVQHLIKPVARPQMFAEHGLYRDQLLEWLNWGLAGTKSLDFYRENNWRVRLVIAGQPIPQLIATADSLNKATAGARGSNLWYIVTPDYDQLWQWHFRTLTSRVRTRTEAIRALYGADIPPASLLVSFGKPLISLDVLPPLLYEEIQCYWTQRPSYELDERELRKIFYDYAYLRRTWRVDKTGRAEEALAHREAWTEGPTIGLGMRLGPFWYPAPLLLPQTNDHSGSNF